MTTESVDLTDIATANNANADEFRRIVGLGKAANLLQFGGVGDNLTDNLGAFNTAIAAVNSQGGGVIYAPAGTYRVSDAIKLGANTKVVGDGPATIIKPVPSGWSHPTTANFGVFTIRNVDDVGICDLTIYGAKTGDINLTPKLIYCETFNRVLVSRCRLTHSDFEGVWMGGTVSNNHYFSFVNNFVDDVGFPNSYTGLPAVQTNCAHFVVANNQIINTGTGIGCTGTRGVVAGNYVQDWLVNAIGYGDANSARGIAIIGNSCKSSIGTSVAAIYGTGGSVETEFNLIAENVIEITRTANSPRGIWITTAAKSVIRGNLINLIDAASIGIEVDGIPGAVLAKAVVDGNTINFVNEVGYCAGINFLCSSASNLNLKAISSNNRVFGLGATYISRAYDWQTAGAGTHTLNGFCINDYGDGGAYRFKGTSYANGERVCNETVV